MERGQIHNNTVEGTVSGVFSLQNCNNINFLSSTFYNNTGFNGGAVNIQGISDDHINFERVNFT